MGYGPQYAGGPNMGMPQGPMDGRFPGGRGYRGRGKDGRKERNQVSPKGNTNRGKKNKEKNSEKKANKQEKKAEPVIDAMSFPPLPVTCKGPDGKPQDSYVGYKKDFKKFQHDDILDIVRAMDTQSTDKEKLNFEDHSAGLTPDAHPNLLKNQRTYSIEQAREAMRHGRPIRSDSVGS